MKTLLKFLKTYWLPVFLGLLVIPVAAGVALDVLPPGLAPILAPSLAIGMGISFNAIPSTIHVPMFAVEFDNSRASQGPTLLPYRVLLIGQRRSTGTAVANSLHKVTNADQVLTLAGRGSMLHRQAIAYFKNNQFTETWIGVLDDNGAGVAATGTLTITGPATAAGTLSLYVAGELVSVAITNAMAQNDIATAVAAAINANLDLPVTAAAVANVVTVTHRHKGTVSNDVDMRLNYQDGQKTPAGVAVAIVAMANGATNPVLTSLLAAMGDNWYHILAHPYSDATSLTALETELSSRFGPMRMIDGVAFTSAAGTQGTLGTLGDTRNSPHGGFAAQPGKNPLTPPSEFAAAVAGVVAFYANIDPARPLQTLPIVGVLPPAEADRFTITERNLLLADGIGTTKVGAGGVVQIERLVTTYQFNAAGAADKSYRDMTTMLTLMYLRYDFRSIWPTKYPRHKLANDGARFGAGQAVITPKIARAETILWFEEKEEMGLVEGIEQFKTDLIVQRSVSDPNRLEFLVPPDLINQFIVGAAAIQFRL